MTGLGLRLGLRVDPGRFSPLAFGAVKLLIGAVPGLIIALTVMGSAAHRTNDNIVVILELYLANGTAKS